MAILYSATACLPRSRGKRFPEELPGIEGRPLGKHFGGLSQGPGHPLDDVGQVAGLRARSPVGGGGLVRRVRLRDQPLRRDDPEGIQRLSRLGPGDGAREGEVAALLEVEARQLHAPAVAVHEHARLGEGLLLEERDEGRVRPVAVHQHGEPVLARQGHVPAQHRELPLQGGARKRGTVQAALAHGHGASPGEQGIEALEVLRVVLGGQLRKELGVDAESHLDARFAARQLQQRLPGLRSDRGNHDALEPSGPGAGEDIGAVGIEPRGIEVTVGVDHRKRGAARRSVRNSSDVGNASTHGQAPRTREAPRYTHARVCGGVMSKRAGMTLLCSALLVVLSGCGDECKDPSDCTDDKGSPSEGKVWACESNKCVERDSSNPGPGDGGTGDAGPADGGDGGPTDGGPTDGGDGSDGGPADAGMSVGKGGACTSSVECMAGLRCEDATGGRTCQSLHVAVTSTGAAGTQATAVRHDETTTAPVALSESTETNRFPRWSADGSAVAFVEGAEGVGTSRLVSRTLPLTAGQSTVLTSGTAAETEDFPQLEWWPSRSLVWTKKSGASTSGLWSVPGAGGTAVALTAS
ncbi:hypothetical protein STIAU_4109, partial [Stigmatella aurantiaca DW4/3-1]